MSALSLRLSWYRRALKSPLRIQDQTLTERRGLFIELIDAKGESLAAAECAPLPGLHRASLEELALAWRKEAASLLQGPLGWENWAIGQPFFGLIAAPEFSEPALQSSIEMLLLSLALKKGCYMPPELSAGKQKAEHSALLQLNRSPRELEDELRQIRERGIRVLKVKIGRAPPAREQELLLRIRASVGRPLRWRLDANQNLGPEELHDWSAFFVREDWPVDYIEEPSPSWTAALDTRWPLALDESLLGHEPDPELLRHKVVILKPNRLGLSRSLAWISCAAGSGGRVVLSNAYESPLSLNLYVWLYGRLCAAPEALGLGTEAAFLATNSSFHEALGFDRNGAPWPKEPWMMPDEAAEIEKSEMLGAVLPEESIP